MIILTRLGGHQMAVNPDLIERVEATPDTVVTLVDGHKHVVCESVTEVIARIRHWRSAVVAEAYLLGGELPDSDGAPPAEPAPAAEEPAADGARAASGRIARMSSHATSDAAFGRVLRLPTGED